MDRKPKAPPLIKRDENNKPIDANEGHRIGQELLSKLLHEQRLADKDNSMHLAKTGKRDVVVHLAVTVLPSVNGVNIIGEVEKEYNQWCFKIPAKLVPMRKANIMRAFAELFAVGRKALMGIGAVID